MSEKILLEIIPPEKIDLEKIVPRGKSPPQLNRIFFYKWF